MRLKAKHIIHIGFILAALPTQLLAEPEWAEQKWSKADQYTWYQLSQGSRLIPLSWFEHIVDPATGKQFASRDNMARFGFPYETDDAPYPIGFVKDKDKKNNQWIGLNCSACHTSVFTKNNREIYVHGGQTMGDFKSLLTSMKLSVKSTIDNPQALENLAEISGSSSDISLLKTKMQAWLDERDDEDIILAGTENWGPGRVDAVAYIQSKAARVVQAERPSAAPQANAPVNPPHVWNTNQQERLQHSGLVSNGPDIGLFGSTRLGAYFRNYAEALGVFSEINIDSEGTVTSSINVQNLMKIERALMTMPSPKWPEDILGEIDKDKAEIGKEIYAQNCISCHSLLAPEDVTTEIKLFKPSRGRSDNPFLKIIPVIDETLTRSARLQGIIQNKNLLGTDPTTLCNFLMRMVPTGKLEGKPKKNSLVSLRYFEKFEDRDAAMEIISAIAVGDIKAKTASGELLQGWVDGEISGLNKIFVSWFKPSDPDAMSPYTSLPKPSLLPTRPIESLYDRSQADCAAFAQGMYNTNAKQFPYPGYKARPLNGIWASPPYLHNGSVPTIYDLLLPQEARPAMFKFTGIEYQNAHIGLDYASDAEPNDFRVFDENGDVLLGQWNGGHEFGVALSEEDKLALLEYLKGL